MDLTRQVPRSPYEALGGCFMMARTIDKARASLAGKLGEYNYDCPLDQQLFKFLEIDANPLLEAVRASSDDEGVLAWVQANQSPHTDEQVEAFNKGISSIGPHDDESKAYFDELRKQVAPNRPDLSTWFDLIEAEEGRLK